MSDVFAPFKGRCDAEGCDEHTPWDMVGILFDHEHGFCSPNCALDWLEAKAEAPEVVTLHDPQYVIDREAIIGGGDVVDFDREVDSYVDAEDAILEARQMYPHEFRMGEKA